MDFTRSCNFRLESNRESPSWERLNALGGLVPRPGVPSTGLPTAYPPERVGRNGTVGFDGGARGIGPIDIVGGNGVMLACEGVLLVEETGRVDGVLGGLTCDMGGVAGEPVGSDATSKKNTPWGGRYVEHSLTNP
jgi:hypothetical protein